MCVQLPPEKLVVDLQGNFDEDVVDPPEFNAKLDMPEDKSDDTISPVIDQPAAPHEVILPLAPGSSETEDEEDVCLAIRIGGKRCHASRRGLA